MSGLTAPVARTILVCVMLGLIGGAFYVQRNAATDERLAKDQNIPEESETPQTWRESLRDWNIEADDCDIRTQELMLFENTRITFDYIHCQEGKEEPFRVVGNQILSTAVYPPTSGKVGETLEGKPIMTFWEVESGQGTREFIESLIANSPNQEQRDHCIVFTEGLDYWPALKTATDEIYTVGADLASKEANPEVAYGMCHPYGSGYYVSFFKRIENMVFLLNIGQDLPHFDPTSIRLIETN